jgi:endonuclease VIII
MQDEHSLEGPPLLAIAEEIAVFKDRRILKVSGNSKIEKDCLKQEKVVNVFSWGKNLFLQFPQFSLKVHFLMFGSYRINEEKAGVFPRLSLLFSEGMLNFYSCSVKLLSNVDLDKLCDKEIDIMSDKWNFEKVVDLASNFAGTQICDVLLDQNVFAGVGNIIKNEALFASKVHPMSIVGKIPTNTLVVIAQAAREFSKLFYEKAKKKESLRPCLRIYSKNYCPDCEDKVKIQYTGSLKRKSYFCESSQRLFT